MRFVTKAAVLLGLACAGLAVPAPQTDDGAAPTDGTSSTTAAANQTNACGVVSQAYSKQLAANPKGMCFRGAPSAELVGTAGPDQDTS